MNKLLLLFSLCCIAYVAAISEDIEVFSLDETAFVQVQSKLGMETRRSLRSQLSEAFFDVNLDDSYIQGQELLEVKQEGTGYGEMGEIMKKVDELEKKIKDKIALDLKYISDYRAACSGQQKQLGSDIAKLQNNLNTNNLVINKNAAAIKNNANSIINSKKNVSKWNDDIKRLTDQRQIDVDAYKVRLAKRLKEINVLNICNNLVCTEFTDFKDTQVCKDILVYGTQMQQYQGQATSETLDDLLKRAADASADYAKKLEASKAQEASLSAATATSAALAGKNVQAASKPGQQIETLLLLLQNSELPAHIFKPARRIISMIRSGEATKSMATGDPATSPTSSSMNLPESLVALLRRITNEQKLETIDYIALLGKYHEQISADVAAIAAEVNRQNASTLRINQSNQYISATRLDSIRRVTIKKVAEDSLNSLLDTCRGEKEGYDKRREGRLGELVNVQKLRSLLRTLQNSELPKCPNDCTSSSQGKCVWQGLFGADSYCACAKGFWGASCEKRMCPGPNGVMYQSDQQLVCSARGTCSDADGKCTCASGYYHSVNNSCEFKLCPGNNNCNGRGKCDQVNGVCSCYDTYYGVECQRSKCLASTGVYVQADNGAVCSGHGACDISNGNCLCGGAYSGSMCQLINCPQNCNGRGACNQANGQCQCYAGFQGGACEQILCPENCSGYGTCNLNNGRCSCGAGSSGPSCRPIGWGNHVAIGNPASWTGNAGYWEWAMCPDQYLMYGLHRGSWDENLRSITHIYCTRPYEGAYPLPLGYCMEQDARSQWIDASNPMSIHWANCQDGMYMRGMLRSPAGGEATVDNIERFFCCRIADNEAVAQVNCRTTNWWSCLDQPAACGVSTVSFMNGLGRTRTSNKVWNIEEARSCQPMRTSSTRQLP